ncbi:MAG TPA: hypothetical protein VFD31_03495 [Thermoleophilaceae bacterium]|nr:hypothetical protein [Thermoleophilaceae bacterium]
MARQLHPAENRGYRELYAYSRALTDHWNSLASWLDAGSLAALTFEKGAAAALELFSALEPQTARYGLHARPAAKSAGRGIAATRLGRNPFLERGQALRLAVEDAQHVTTLLAYLATVADSRGDSELAEFCGRWERKLKRHESAARKAAVEQGAEPDAAIEPLHSGPAGRAAHSVGYAIGTLGEWVDGRVGRRH